MSSGGKGRELSRTPEGIGEAISSFFSKLGSGEGLGGSGVGSFSEQWRENNPNANEDNHALKSETSLPPAARFSADSHKRRRATSNASPRVLNEHGMETITDTPQQPRGPSNIPSRRSRSPRPPHPKRLQFASLLREPRVSIAQLRQLAWNGIPDEYRATCWQILLGYLPSVAERRASTVKEKRALYWNAVTQFFGENGEAEETVQRSEYETEVYHQVSIDVPRTNPMLPLFQIPTIHRILLRILYVWAIRHPASGYVQGINDLVTPFLCVFLQPHLTLEVGEREGGTDGRPPTHPEDVEYLVTLPPCLSDEVLKEVEADVYWCVTKFIDCIQDCYTTSQPGIQRMLYRLEELVRKIDRPLHLHLQQQRMEFVQFAFRWMNCLLMRELPIRGVFRTWDTYLAEESFASLHVFLCAAFLENWSVELQKKDFPALITFLQRPPTSEWREEDLEPLLAQAYVWMSMYNDAPGHLA